MDKKYTVFVSSTFEDLKVQRDAVVKALLEMGHIPLGMEMFSAADDTQWRLIQRNIDLSDYYIVIIAHRYGSMDGGVSYTEKEYDYAIAQKIPILGLLLDKNAEWPANYIEQDRRTHIKKFRAKVSRKTVKFWTTKDDLAAAAVLALGKQIPITPRPGWVRGSEAAGPEVAAELSRLSSENADLRNRLEGLAVPRINWHILFARAGKHQKSNQLTLKAVLYVEVDPIRPIVIPRHQFRLSFRSEDFEAVSASPISTERDPRSLIDISAGEITLRGSGIFVVNGVCKEMFQPVVRAELNVSIRVGDIVNDLQAPLAAAGATSLEFATPSFDYDYWNRVADDAIRRANRPGVVVRR
jgi:hypothetical protein